MSHTRKYVTRAMFRGIDTPVIVTLNEMGEAVDVLDAATLDRDRATVIVDTEEIRQVQRTYRHPMAELNRRVNDHLRGAR